MQRSNPNAATQNTYVKQTIGTVVYIHCSPVTAPGHCKRCNLERGGVQSVECEENGVLSGECGV